MQSIPEVVAFIASLAFFFVFIYLMFTRYLSYRETMRMIERGLLTPRRKRSDGKELLRWGIIICAIGIGLGVGLAPLGSIVDGGVGYWGAMDGDWERAILFWRCVDPHSLRSAPGAGSGARRYA
jgi:hypothetical protein